MGAGGRRKGTMKHPAEKDVGSQRNTDGELGGYRGDSGCGEVRERAKDVVRPRVLFQSRFGLVGKLT